MYKIGFLLKTCEQDYKYAKRFLESYFKYNVDHIPCFVVAPSIMLKLIENDFENILNGKVFLVDESQFDEHFVNESIDGLSVGYINQEIVKLAFWEKGFCENYMCIDSDAVFIRNFRISDFMYNTDVPYTVLYEDKWLMTDPDYYNSFGKYRDYYLDKIKKVFELQDKHVKTCHGFQIISSVVMKSMKENYMEPNDMSYSKMMQIAPYEFSWYNFWLQKDNTIDIVEIDELFCTFHMYKNLQEAWFSKRSLEDLARSYIGIVINSNFLSGKMCNYSDYKEQKIGLRRMLRGLVRLYWGIVKNKRKRSK